MTRKRLLHAASVAIILAGSLLVFPNAGAPQTKTTVCKTTCVWWVFSFYNKCETTCTTTEQLAS